MKKFIFILLVTIFAAVASVFAQQELDIQKNQIGWGEKPIPITLSGFSGEVAQVLRFDLEVQGFKVVTGDPALQYDVTGSNDGNVQGKLMDHVSRQQKLARSYSGGPLRAQAHAFADDIVFVVTGRKGIGQTKIAFKVDTGPTSEIYVSDFDGHNATPVTQDGSIVAAPCWVPGHMGLYYVSYKLGNAYIFAHNLTTGARTVFSRHGGSNLSPAVSPGADRVAMILSKDGWVDLYVANVDGTGIKRLTKSPQDESSPCWSPDGKWILFAGKDGERRVLRKVSADGGAVMNVRAAGTASPSEPDWSPDDKWIVFTRQRGADSFDICIVPAAGGIAEVLTEGEDPSWAPNSRTVIFARRSGNGRVLSVLDVFTKQVKDVARISGSNSQPSWAK